MALATDTTTNYAADFERFQQRLTTQPAWISAIRKQAFRRFQTLGFPTTKHEEWRFTNIAPILKTTFTETPAPRAAASRTPLDLSAYAIDSTGLTLVFVDGHYRHDLSSRKNLPGVTVHDLCDALLHHSELLRPYLAQFASYANDAFTALNTAMMEDGAFIHVAAKSVVEQPIHLLFVSTKLAAAGISHPRNLIVAEAQSQVDIIEHYVSLASGSSGDESVYFANCVTEVVAGPSSRVHHYMIEADSKQAYNVSTLRVQQDRSSRFESHTVLLGGALVRNNVHVELHGPGCESLVNGLYLPTGTQHMDNHMRVVHAQPNCGSRQFYKGVLDDKSSAVFSGRIVVHEGAQKTDAKQTNRNLLLSDAAHVDTKPQLEIYADDVKCTHGATIGQLDEDAIFYLRARGVPLDTARSLLIYAFAHESLERMTLEPVRAMLEKQLFSRLPGAEGLEAML
jgi:Fe-S cluster assembly protein SufD